MQIHYRSFTLGIASTLAAGTVLLNTALVPSITAQHDDHAMGGMDMARMMEEHHAVTRAAQHAQMMAVAYQVDNSGFHELDESLAAGQMVSNALGKVRKARIAVQATNWPHELSANAARLVTEFERLESGLRDEDLARAAPAAKAAHNEYHSLSDGVYAILSGTAPSHGH